jgi:hypothetical protein
VLRLSAVPLGTQITDEVEAAENGDDAGQDEPRGLPDPVQVLCAADGDYRDGRQRDDHDNRVAVAEGRPERPRHVRDRQPVSADHDRRDDAGAHKIPASTPNDTSSRKFHPPSPLCGAAYGVRTAKPSTAALRSGLATVFMS